MVVSIMRHSFCGSEVKTSKTSSHTPALAQRVKRLTGCPGEVVFQPLHYTDVELRIPNIEKARDLLGFEAKVDLDEGLERTIAWYRENGTR